MRFIFILFIVLISNASHAQLTTHVFWTEETTMPAADVIFYKPDKLLKWNDFKGKPDMSSSAVAITVSGFGYKAQMKNRGNEGEVNIMVYCFFNKPKSWVKEGRTSENILVHEQRHFDISYLAANIFIEKVNATSLTISNMNTLLPRLYTECSDLMNKLQDDYDGQTKNGQLSDMQQKWNAFIDARLSKFTK